MIRLYRLVSSMAYPFVWLWLQRRVQQGKEDASRLTERLGVLSITRPKGTVIWVHAASVGEANSVIPLIKRLHDASTDHYIVMTTGTVSSAKLMDKRLPERAFHHYVPIDIPFIVKRFLHKLKPDLAIWVESEFWPNLILACHRQHTPMILVNARLSKKSSKRWQRARDSFLQLITSFNAVYAGSLEDKERLHALGLSAVNFAGNLKYDVESLQADPKQTSDILTNIGDRPVWLASSTHPGEEEIVARIHRELQEIYPDLLTLIAPRHTYRADAVHELLSQHKLTVARRSMDHMILPETDIYLIDTMGELGIFYRLSGVVFIGGSLVSHGGHNPIEPAQLDCAIICGIHMDNFSGIVEEFRAAEAIQIAANETGLKEQVTILLRDDELQQSLADKAHQLVDAKRGAADFIFNDIAQQQLGITVAKQNDAANAQEQEVSA